MNRILTGGRYSSGKNSVDRGYIWKRTSNPICLGYKVNEREAVENTIIKAGWNQIMMDQESQLTLLGDELTSD